LKGRLTDRVQVSTDGKEYRPSSEFPELAELLTAAAPIPSRPPPPKRGAARPAPAVAESAPAEVPAEEEVPLTERFNFPPVDTSTAPPEPEVVQVPHEGDLANVSVLRLYA